MITIIPDGSTLIQLINFLVLLWILNLVFYKPIRNVLIQRKDKVDGLKAGVEKLSEDEVEKGNAFENGLKEARAKGVKEKETLIDQASVEEKEIIGKINQEAQAKLVEIKKQVVEETEKARVELEKDVEIYAREIGEKILGRAC
jgi:F-type H+-transporting ATPase subunit b